MVDRAKQLYQLIAHSTIGNRAKSTGQGGGPLVIFYCYMACGKKIIEEGNFVSLIVERAVLGPAKPG